MAALTVGCAAMNDPAGRYPAGSVVFGVSGWCSVRRDFCDGGAG